MACEPGAALNGHSERGKWVDGCPGSTRTALRLRAGDGVGRSLWLLGLSGDPLHQGAPSPLERAARGSLRCRAQGGRPQLQPTGRTRQKRAEGMAGVAEEKPTKGAARSPLLLALEF